MSGTKNIHTLRSEQSKLDVLLDALDHAQDVLINRERRTAERASYRRRLNVRVIQPGGSQAVFEMVSRNLSAGGICLVHGGYLHAGTRCAFDLITNDNAWETIGGTVQHCRLVGGRIHELGIKFDSEIELARFLPSRLTGRILVVDDAPDFLALTRHHLEKNGLSVASANSGHDALKMISDGEFDMVLLDVQMEGMDGLTLTRRLRSQGFNGPIIAMSGDTTVATRKSCIDAGADEFLPKPFEREVLAEVILRHTSDRDPIVSAFASNPEMAEFIQRFIDDLPQRIQEMHDAVTAEDASRMLSLARNLKSIAGGSSGCGFEEISSAAATLEQSSMGTVNWDEVAQKLAELVALARRVQ